MKPNRRDMIYLFERLVKGPAEAGEDFVDKIPTELALYVLGLAKRAPWPRGPHTKSRRNYDEAWVIRRALLRKRELQDGGVSSASKALEQAAKEASMTEDAKRLRLSASAIQDKMHRKRSRR